MKIRLFIVSLLVVLFASAGMALAADIGGKWVFDKKEFQAAMRAQQEPGQDEDDRLMLMMVSRFVARVYVTFDTEKKEMHDKGIDGKITVSKYTVISESDEEVRLEVDGRELIISITGPDSIKLNRGQSVTMKRVQ